MSTAGDREVLNSIMNPMLPLGEAVYDPNEAIVVVDEVDTDQDPSSLKAHELELSAIRLIESNDKAKLTEAISLMNEAVDLNPLRSATYNNRAQVFRLTGDVAAAMADLNKAIELSGGRGRAGCQALTQRALIHRLEEREVEATADLRLAASLGSGFAKALLVQMNPYAAMCNQMLKNVFTALERGDDHVVNPFADMQDGKRG